MDHDQNVCRLGTGKPPWFLRYVLGPCFIIFGLIPICFALTNEPRYAVITAAALLMGACFFGFAYMMMATQSTAELRVDAHSGVLEVNGKTYRLEEFDHVEFIRVPQDEGDDRYSVSLIGDQRRLEVSSPGDYEQARREGEAVANLLHFDLHDSSEDRTIVREAGTLDESLRARSIRLGESATAPQPAELLTSVSWADVGSLVLRIPPPPLLRELPVVLLIAIFEAIFVAAVGPRGGQFILAVFTPALMIPWILYLPHVIRRYGVERITVSQEELTHTHRTIFGQRTHGLAADEIEELLESDRGVEWLPFVAHTDHGEIVARTDHGEIRFGGHLPVEERKYLQALVRSVLTSSCKENGPVPR